MSPGKEISILFRRYWMNCFCVSPEMWRNRATKVDTLHSYHFFFGCHKYQFNKLNYKTMTGIYGRIISNVTLPGLSPRRLNIVVQSEWSNTECLVQWTDGAKGYPILLFMISIRLKWIIIENTTINVTFIQLQSNCRGPSHWLVLRMMTMMMLSSAVCCGSAWCAAVLRRCSSFGRVPQTIEGGAAAAGSIGRGN